MPGEHKIMSHIRLQRAQPGYNPNIVHVLHGLDADLIMLALATHEAHFYISREEVLFGRKSEEQTSQRRMENGYTDAQKQLDEAAGSSAMQMSINQNKILQRISIPILREYLAAEFVDVCIPGRLPFPFSLERLIDDIVFLCFFVGNDFLPHLPSLDIRDGALDYLFNVYKRILPGLGDYITKSGGQVNLRHVDLILAEVGQIEDYVFAMKHENEQRLAQQRDAMKGSQKKQQKPPLQTTKIEHVVRGRAARILERTGNVGNEVVTALGAPTKNRNDSKIRQIPLSANEDAARVLKESLALRASNNSNSNNVIGSTRISMTTGIYSEGTVSSGNDSQEKRKRDDDLTSANGDVQKNVVDSYDAVADIVLVDDDCEEIEDEENDIEASLNVVVQKVDPEVAKVFKEKVKAKQQAHLDALAEKIEDKVLLHEPGWKDRYYKDKCKADDVEAHGGREHLFRSYIVGLCWVMKYYYSGVSSWKWYFPFHYAPFASDLKNIERFDSDCKSFQLAKPFNPVEQLMAVLPPDSVHAIPKASQWLMIDSESPIVDFYPNDVPVDPNGKAMPWLWVVLLPFIDEDRLLAALTPTVAQWTTEELFCNGRGLDDGYLYVHKNHGLAGKLSAILQNGKTAQSPKMRLTDAAYYGSPGFGGSVRPPLSNEHFATETGVTIKLPSSAGKISISDPIFLDDLEDNVAICVAFTEPQRLPHKSVLLPGTKPPKHVLNPDDKRIRRPRLNRGGGTIANLGIAPSAQSHQSGYGSMNVNEYERGLAERTGRGREMYQTGMRAWGAMEPTPKRFQAGVSVNLPNPLLNQQHQAALQWQQLPMHQVNGHHVQGMHPAYQNSHFHQQSNPSQSTYQNFASQHHHFGVQPSRQNPLPSIPPHVPPFVSQPLHPSPQQGFNFRHVVNQPGPQPYNVSAMHQQPQQQSRASADVMNSLRAQLSNTIQQNRRGPSDSR
jgi:5'-3' exoribonuclease 2